MTLPLALFHKRMASGVAASFVRQLCFSKYACASSERRTESYCPVPMMSRSAPSLVHVFGLVQ